MIYTVNKLFKFLFYHLFTKEKYKAKQSNDFISGQRFFLQLFSSLRLLGQVTPG